MPRGRKKKEVVKRAKKTRIKLNEKYNGDNFPSELMKVNPSNTFCEKCKIIDNRKYKDTLIYVMNILHIIGNDVLEFDDTDVYGLGEKIKKFSIKELRDRMELSKKMKAEFAAKKGEKTIGEKESKIKHDKNKTDTNTESGMDAVPSPTIKRKRKKVLI